MSGSEPSASGEPRAGDRLLGRARELRVLRALLEETHGGAVALVHGSPGIGKSALLAAVRDDARGRGSTVLSTAGVRAEAALPFAALERLLHGMLDRAQAL